MHDKLTTVVLNYSHGRLLKGTGNVPTLLFKFIFIVLASTVEAHDTSNQHR